jgi:uncharacterized RDD family membrane protein YckC
MKCPKCGYLGFETTDRCRNCQYDFSLATVTTDPELALHADRRVESNSDFELPPIKRQTDSLSASALDLDRLFGTAEPAEQATAVPAPTGPATRILDDGAEPPSEPLSELSSELSSEPSSEPPSEPSSELPFDDAPIVPPPAARPPLAVRRSTPELPRNRPRTTRPVRSEPLQLEAEPHGRGSAVDIVASLMETPALSARVGAGLIDTALLVAIDLTVLFLTLRITGLQSTVDDVRVLPPIPFAGFLAILTFGYVSAFTVAGGQTIGKMIMNLRVIGDDGRPVDAAGGMLRAAGCMLVPVTFGLSYVPALVTSDHRALHDRLAGTRVVRE